MMSLVAYAASSSDEENSDNESVRTESNNDNTSNISSIHKSKPIELEPESDEDSFTSELSSIEPPSTSTTSTQFKLNLPAPSISSIETIIENDDEFLRKKAVPTQLPPPPIKNKMIAKKREKVKIIIPALSEYDDEKFKGNIVTVAPQPLTSGAGKSSSLLNLLPKPKIEQFSTGNAKRSTTTTSMIPHSVAKKQSSEIVATSSTSATSTKPHTKSLPNIIPQSADSDDDDDDDEDFFSLNTNADLPEANLQKINELVINKMTSISNAMKHKVVEEESANDHLSSNVEETNEPITSKMDQKTMEALCGSSAKRSRKYEDVNIIDISDDQVLPNRDEWLRQQLTSKTEYQPKGLVDEEPGAGTRKKHQITYLAHQARANEQELQAMWAANRHARRLTQNKYGF